MNYCGQLRNLASRIIPPSAMVPLVLILGLTLDSPWPTTFASSQGTPAKKPYPGGVPADIWVLAGQSNAHGWGLFKAPIDSDPRILQLDDRNEWVRAEAPLQEAGLTTYTTGVMRNNILLQREGVLPLPPGLTPEQFVRQLESRKKPLIGIGPGMFFAKHLLQFIDRPIGIIPLGAMGSSIKQWDPKTKNSPSESNGWGGVV